MQAALTRKAAEAQDEAEQALQKSGACGGRPRNMAPKGEPEPHVRESMLDAQLLETQVFLDGK